MTSPTKQRANDYVIHWRAESGATGTIRYQCGNPNLTLRGAVVVLRRRARREWLKAGRDYVVTDYWLVAPPNRD